MNMPKNSVANIILFMYSLDHFRPMSFTKAYPESPETITFRKMLIFIDIVESRKIIGMSRNKDMCLYFSFHKKYIPSRNRIKGNVPNDMVPPKSVRRFCSRFFGTKSGMVGY